MDFAFFSRNICLPIEALAGFILMGCTPAKNLQSKYRKAHGPYPDHPYPCDKTVQPEMEGRVVIQMIHARMQDNKP